MTNPIDTNRLSAGQKKALALLQDLGQNHVFEKWEPSGRDEEKKQAFLESVLQVESSYPGGLRVYLENAKKLLEESRQGKNPYEGLTPENPETVSLTEWGDAYLAFEEKGLALAGGLVVVLVAGGLGERLGYSGIKVDIPVEVTTGQTYLGLYASTIRALQGRAKTEVPFVIMTSRDTHERTLASLEKNNYFGLKKTQVHLI
ncbi:MAG: UTP--glucose-1-phosphate uridylyltransferase, partial [Spirochaetia bacterium]|nr:UTP--glucose-1-phosphate uridylyltransferase [Spirochaetia bacterium]